MLLMTDESVQPYQRIVLSVQEKIKKGQLPAHTKLPSTRELRDQYEVSAGTVQRALSELRTQGLIYSHQGRGSYISSAAATAIEDPTARAIKDLEERVTALTIRLNNLDGRSES